MKEFSQKAVDDYNSSQDELKEILGLMHDKAAEDLVKVQGIGARGQPDNRSVYDVLDDLLASQVELVKIRDALADLSDKWDSEGKDPAILRDRIEMADKQIKENEEFFVKVYHELKPSPIQ